MVSNVMEVGTEGGGGREGVEDGRVEGGREGGREERSEAGWVGVRYEYVN